MKTDDIPSVIGSAGKWSSAVGTVFPGVGHIVGAVLGVAAGLGRAGQGGSVNVQRFANIADDNIYRGRIRNPYGGGATWEYDTVVTERPPNTALWDIVDMIPSGVMMGSDMMGGISKGAKDVKATEDLKSESTIFDRTLSEWTRDRMQREGSDLLGESDLVSWPMPKTGAGAGEDVRFSPTFQSLPKYYKTLPDWTFERLSPNRLYRVYRDAKNLKQAPHTESEIIDNFQSISISPVLKDQHILWSPLLDKPFSLQYKEDQNKEKILQRQKLIKQLLQKGITGMP